VTPEPDWYVPDTQLVHATELVEALKVPDGQVEQLEDDEDEENLPASQIEHEIAAAAAYLPATQETHVVATTAPKAAEAVPSEQSLHIMAPVLA
jgi:hypothetical protein